MMNDSEFLLKYKKSDQNVWQGVTFSDVIVVGSGENSALRLDDGQLSENHFEICEDPTGVYLKDLTSEDGITIFDGKEIEAGVPISLDIGQKFTAGNYEFIFSLNVPEPQVEKQGVQKLIFTLKDIGWGRIAIMSVGLIGLAVLSGFLIFRYLLQPKASTTTEMIVTEAAEVAVAVQATMVAELSSTQAFEMASTLGVEEVLDAVVAPGEGQINLESIILNLEEMSFADLNQMALNPGANVDMVVDFAGENVGYIYEYTGLIVDGQVITTGLEFIASEDEQFVDGVLTPSWPDGNIPVSLDWKPFVYEVRDDEKRVVALLVPENYGSVEKDSIYHLIGVYQPEGSDTQYNAHLRFNGEGEMIDVLTFGVVGTDRPSPYRIDPQIGDAFTILHQVFNFDDELTQTMEMQFAGSQVPQSLLQLWASAMQQNQDNTFLAFGPGIFENVEGSELVFGEEGIRWEKVEDYSGEFVVGVAVEDLDGNTFLGYFPLQIGE